MLNRFRSISLILFVLVLMAQAQPPAPPAKTSLAVYPIKPAGSSPDLATAMTALLVSELTPSPKLKVIEEAMLKTVMERQAMNVSDACDDTSCQVEIGKLVKAQKMVVGDLTKFGNKYILAVKLVDIQSGVVEFTGQDKCTCTEENLDSLVIAVAARVRNHFGETLTIPNLPQNAGAQVSSPAQSSQAQPAMANWVPGKYTIQESHPPGTKGGPMVYVSDFKFYIDKFEVTNQDFQECIDAGSCKKHQSGFRAFDVPNQPAVLVGCHNYTITLTNKEAQAYCQWAGKRLPTDAEWTHAATGTDSRKYPWGNQEPSCELANYKGCKKLTLPVGSEPAGASPYGALDMAGNAAEWVAEGSLHGGSYNSPAEELKNSFTGAPTQAGDRIWTEVGFRCARDGSP